LRVEQPFIAQNWIEYSYDALGRPKTIKAPGESITQFFYNETNRPSGATQDPGQTMRQVDPVGRERWMLSDALGRIRQVVEPDPDGTGSVFGGTPLITNYSYGAQSLRVNQGAQEWRFRFDSLGRLTHQALPGREATLDGPGNKKFSDVFTYDQSSNLLQHVDARGVGPSYRYDNDPLHRLQRIEGGSGDTVFDYVTSGDLHRPRKITTSGVIEEVYDYDGEGRLAAIKRLLPDRPNFSLDIDYGYDLFGRLSELRYPAQFGVVRWPPRGPGSVSADPGLGTVPNPTRRLVSYEYGLDGRPWVVKLDGEPVASDIAYNPSGQIVSMTLGLPNGPRRTQETYRYNDNGLLKGLTITRNGQELMWTNYDHSKAGQVISQLDSNAANVRSYSYDALGRLKTAVGQRDSVNGGWDQTYRYDRYENRTSTQAAGVTSTSTPIPTDGSAQLSIEENTGRITNSGFAYDAAGNMTRAPRRDGFIVSPFSRPLSHWVVEAVDGVVEAGERASLIAREPPASGAGLEDGAIRQNELLYGRILCRIRDQAGGAEPVGMVVVHHFITGCARLECGKQPRAKIERAPRPARF
jgi:hypothetical protein